MNIRSFVRALLVGAGLLVAYGIYLLITQWQYLTIGNYAVRHNQLTGIVQAKVGENWMAFRDDSYADALPEETIHQIGVSDLTWGADGLLCGQIVNRTSQRIKGRLAFRIVLRKLRDDNYIKDRALRENVDIPAGGSLPFVLRTGLATPDTTRVRTTLELQPTSYSGA